MTLLIVYAIVSIFFSFLCSILEAVLLSLSPTFLKMKLNEGKSYAQTLIGFKKDIDRPLTAILTFNTVAHTVGAILVGVQAEKTFGSGNNSVAIISAIMTFLILVLSEIIPKTIGATYWKSLGPFTAFALSLLMFPLKWTGILWFLTLTTKLIGKSAHIYTLSREEFLAMTNTAEEEGVFEENETTYIKNLLVFRNVEAKDIMTPFSVVITEDETTTIEEFYEDNKHLKHSRIPIYKERSNNITGFILKDDVLEEMIDQKGPEPLSSLKREVLTTSSNTPIPELFEILIEKRTHITIVSDEYGNPIGIVTMEDIIETLLGLEIMDESDNVADMQAMARKNWETRAKRLGIINPKPKEEDPE